MLGALRGRAACKPAASSSRIAVFKRKPVLFGAGGVLLAFVIYLVASSTIHARHAREAAAAAAAAEKKVAQAEAAAKAEAVQKAQAAALAQAAAQKAEAERRGPTAAA